MDTWWSLLVISFYTTFLGAERYNDISWLIDKLLETVTLTNIYITFRVFRLDFIFFLASDNNGFCKS